LLRLTVPGVPDTYQGNELWAFNLVDPDNRQPVDYARRAALLEALIARCEDDADLSQLVRELLETLDDGRAKLYLTWRALQLRNRHPALFAAGDYTSLSVEGPRADHICAFARRHEDTTVIVAVARWFARLMGDEPALPPGRPVWGETWLEAPEKAAADGYRNLLTNESVPVVGHRDRPGLRAADLFAGFPVALLTDA
jgi:(1->4)-alpha-D-glucan 1-alpha-D-glucosylmutase